LYAFQKRFSSTCRGPPFTVIFVPMATRLVLFAACSALASSIQVDIDASVADCEGDTCVVDEEASLLQLRVSKIEEGDQPSDAADTAAPDDAEDAINETEVATETTGACTASDLDTLRGSASGNGDASLGAKISRCMRRSNGISYNWRLGFKPKRNKKCLKKKLNLSTSCTQCLVAGSRVAFHDCKWKCATVRWCSKQCLSCMREGWPAVHKCIGAELPPAEICDGTEATSVGSGH